MCYSFFFFFSLGGGGRGGGNRGGQFDLLCPEKVELESFQVNLVMEICVLGIWNSLSPNGFTSNGADSYMV